MRLANKIIVITGAASGIGQASAELCEREGARVIGLDKASGVDVGDEASIREFFAPIETIDTLVNCAGTAVRKPLADQDAEGWDEVFRVNVRGTYLCSKYAIAKMKARGGSIIHLSSVVGVTGVRNRAAYSSTKGALISLTRSMALDYAQYQIRVNAICPGFTRTNLTKGLLSNPDSEAKLTSLHPLGRLGLPEDIAHLVVFLASDESSWITGQAIAVDGGFTAGHALDV
jgi:NAD(P)-dependent dehydrogenase (short-subunit alcohol dehydrogenase family)